MSTFNGTSGNDTLIGTYADDTMNGLDGFDSLTAKSGDDLLDGGAGGDFLDGGFGDDTLLGGDGGDLLSGSFGDDSLAGGAGSDRFEDGYGNNMLSGGDDADTFVVQPLDGGTTIATGGAGQDRYQLIFASGAPGEYPVTAAYASRNFVVTDFAAGPGGDVLDESNLLQWSAFDGGYTTGNPFSAALGYLRLQQSGADTLVQWDRDGAAGGAYGWITMITLQNVTAANLVTGNFGSVVTGNYGSEFPPDGSSASGVSLSGGADNTPLYGTGFNDTLVGGTGGGLLDGGGGNDLIQKGAGTSFLAGGLGNDTIIGGAGNDFLAEAGFGDDSLVGGAGDDFFNDDYGSNTLNGGDGADSFEVQAFDGGSTVTGGLGADLYYVLDPRGNRDYVITDFAAGPGGDLLDIGLPLYFSALDGGYSSGNPFNASERYLRFKQSGSDALLQWDRDGLAGGDHGWVTLLTLQNRQAASLTADNFDNGVPPDGSAGAGQLITGPNSGGVFGSGSFLGGFFNDTLQGTSVGDVMNAEEGDDLINAGGGDDLIFDSLGNDTIIAGDGNDEVNGQLGDDSISAGAGDDRIFEFSGDNVIDAGDGDDVIRMGFFDGSSIVTGGAGRDIFVLLEDLGIQTLVAPYVDRDWIVTDFTAGAGGDLLRVDDLLNTSGEVAGYDGGNPFSEGFLRLIQSGADTLLQWDRDGKAGLDDGWITTVRLQGIAKASITSDNFEGQLIIGTEADDDLLGGLGNDTIEGLGGNDTLDGVFGQDSMEGDAGDDFYYVNSAGDLVVEQLGEGIDTVRSTISYTLASEVEDLNLSGAKAINGTGNELANAIQGNNADNKINGGFADDTLYGVGGNDTVIGGDGDDLIEGGSGAGDDRYVGGPGSDTVRYSSAVHAVTVDLKAQHGSGIDVGNDTLLQIENLIGGRGSDSFSGSEDANVLYGAAGNDTLIGIGGNDLLQGGTGLDSMLGGKGDDSYIVEQVGDTVGENAGDGTDLVNSSISYTLGTNVENLFLLGTGKINGTGNQQGNVLTGNAARNLLAGMNGADTLNGGLGNDTLNGGAGADQYWFTTATGAQNADVIQGFVSGTDKIALGDVIYAGLGTLGAFAPNDPRFYAAPGAAGGSDLTAQVVYDTQSGRLYYDFDGSGSGAAMLIATLSGHLGLAATDILVN